MRQQDKEVINSKCREEWERLVYSWIHSEVDRKMFARWGLDGIAIEDIAEEFELSTNRCQERISDAKEQLFNHIEIL